MDVDFDGEDVPEGDASEEPSAADTSRIVQRHHEVGGEYPP